MDSSFAGLLLKVVLPLALLVGAGGVWARFGHGIAVAQLRAEIGRLVINLFAPALLFAVTATTSIDRHLLMVPVIVGGTTLSAGALLYLLFFRSALGRNLSDPTRATLLLCGMFGNVLFMGLPLLGFVFGQPGERYPVFADVLATTPLVWTLGVWIATRLGSHHPEEGRGFWHSLLRLPPVWAFATGMACNALKLPVEPLASAARFMGQPTIPLMIFVIGLAVPWHDLRPNLPVMVAVSIKVVLMPLLALGVLHLAGYSLDEPRVAAIIETAVPTMVLAIVFADLFHLDTRAAALVMGWSTLLSILTLPAWLFILHI
ncbi:MAG TPA: AEC family transporter [Thiobacillaceae bacterium]|nr:AEC family transporter [Thiobacillaceae bacterium]